MEIEHYHENPCFLIVCVSLEIYNQSENKKHIKLFTLQHQGSVERMLLIIAISCCYDMINNYDFVFALLKKLNAQADNYLHSKKGSVALYLTI